MVYLHTHALTQTHAHQVGDTCEYIGKCPQPVCNQDTMYNDTKVEQLCGICVLAGQVSRVLPLLWSNASSSSSSSSSSCFAWRSLAAQSYMVA